MAASGTSRSASGQQASPAQASSGSSTTLEAETRRGALYREGVEAATAGRWSDARDRFSAALAIRASAKVLFSLAQAEERLGRVASAQATYARALDAAKTAGERDVVLAAEQAQRALEPRVPHLKVVVTGAGSDNAAATLDEQPIGVGRPVAVDPGPHRLVVSAAGMRPETTNVAIGERQQLDVPARLVPLDAPPAPVAAAAPASIAARQGEAPLPSPRGGGPWPEIGLAVAGLGVVGLGIGLAFGIEAKSENDQSNRSGCAGDNCSPGAAAIRRDALSAADVSTVAFVAGGALAASGLAIWLLVPSRGKANAVGVAPVALRGGGGLLFTGTWPLVGGSPW